MRDRANPPQDEPVPDWHLAIVRERLAEAEANPEAGIPWEEVKAELWPDA